MILGYKMLGTRVLELSTCDMEPMITGYPAYFPQEYSPHKNTENLT